MILDAHGAVARAIVHARTFFVKVAAQLRLQRASCIQG